MNITTDTSNLKKNPTDTAARKRKRYLFARNLRDVLHQATHHIIDKRGQVFAALYANWPDIIGAEYSKDCHLLQVIFPQKSAKNGILHLRVAPHIQAEIPYHTPLILEKCASHLGYRAVEKIVALPYQATTTKPDFS